ncbi:sulfatase [Paenibacillus sp. 1P07SE]|uniref:sulfatase family protein n=1 Tax=Paenibacillus sp. 1P07SE TaxID=3132209 RepID=UPI0039A5A776
MRPNVILVTTDQQRKDSLGCYGSDFMNTPHLDRLAGEGACFHRAYCTNPVCTPSRASLYSGKYVSRHGAWNIGVKVPDKTGFVQDELLRCGYRTHHIGKLHFQPHQGDAQSIESRRHWRQRFPDFTGPYYGFETVELSLGHTLQGVEGHYGLWVEAHAGTTAFEAKPRSAAAFGGEAVDWELPAELSNAAWVKERTVRFLEAHAAERRDQPFFLSIGFQDPHHPHALPKGSAEGLEPWRYPAPKYEEGELLDKPPYFQTMREGGWDASHPLHGSFPMAGQGPHRFRFDQVSAEDQQWGRAYYYRMVEKIDEAMGGILEALEALGLKDDTIVVFTSDHGELLGDHGLWMKGPFHYEQLINVPLLIWWPGHIAPTSSEEIISLADVAPTLLSLCGVTVPPVLDGKDWSGHLTAGSPVPRQAALIEAVDDPAGIRCTTVVTGHYKLTVHHGSGYGELYDLMLDPGEIVNRWREPAYHDIQTELFGLLLAELESTAYRVDRHCYG